jgi:hypothetical protein
VWNHFNLRVDFREVKGDLQYTAQCGGINNGCSTGGAHPDNDDQNFASDPKYATLGVNGEGSGNKNWLRWGKPGKVVQAGHELGWVRCAFPTEIYTQGCHWFPRLFAA